MVVARGAREDPLVHGGRHRLVAAAREHEAALGAEERLVGRAGQDVRALGDRVLERAARDEPEDVRPVEDEPRARLGGHLAQVGHGLREQEEAPAEHGDRGALAGDQVARRGDVDPPPVRGRRPGEDALGALPEAAHAVVGDVPPHRDAVRDDRRAAGDKPREHGLVGDGAGDGPDVGPPAAEEAPADLGRLRLDFVHVARALVVAAARVPLRVAVEEVRVEDGAGGAREHVLRRDEVQRLRPPCVVAIERLAKVLEEPLRVFEDGVGHRTSGGRVHVVTPPSPEALGRPRRAARARKATSASPAGPPSGRASRHTPREGGSAGCRRTARARARTSPSCARARRSA